MAIALDPHDVEGHLDAIGEQRLVLEHRQVEQRLVVEGRLLVDGREVAKDAVLDLLAGGLRRRCVSVTVMLPSTATTMWLS